MNPLMNSYPERRGGSAAAKSRLVPQPILLVLFDESQVTRHQSRLRLSTFNFELSTLFAQAHRRSHLDTSRGRRRGRLRPGGDGPDCRGKWRPKRIFFHGTIGAWLCD